MRVFQNYVDFSRVAADVAGVGSEIPLLETFQN